MAYVSIHDSAPWVAFKISFPDADTNLGRYSGSAAFEGEFCNGTASQILSQDIAGTGVLIANR